MGVGQSASRSAALVIIARGGRRICAGNANWEVQAGEMPHPVMSWQQMVQIAGSLDLLVGLESPVCTWGSCHSLVIKHGPLEGFRLLV